MKPKYSAYKKAFYMFVGSGKMVRSLLALFSLVIFYSSFCGTANVPFILGEYFCYSRHLDNFLYSVSPSLLLNTSSLSTSYNKQKSSKMFTLTNDQIMHSTRVCEMTNLLPITYVVRGRVMFSDMSVLFTG